MKRNFQNYSIFAKVENPSAGEEISRYTASQSMQSAKLFLQSSELGLPQPLTRRRVCPPPVLAGGAHSLAREGLGESQVRRGDLPVVLFIYMYFVQCTALSVNTNTSCNKIKPEALTFSLLHRSCPDF
jgi:hypothetical protein